MRGRLPLLFAFALVGAFVLVGDAAAGPVHGGPVRGGLTEAAADALYLRLDAANDPVTEPLSILVDTVGVDAIVSVEHDLAARKACWEAINGSGDAQLCVGGSTHAGTFLGVNRADLAFLDVSGAANGAAIGTSDTEPFTLGTNNAARLTFGASGGAAFATNIDAQAAIAASATQTCNGVASYGGVCVDDATGAMLAGVLRLPNGTDSQPAIIAQATDDGTASGIGFTTGTAPGRLIYDGQLAFAWGNSLQSNRTHAFEGLALFHSTLSNNNTQTCNGVASYGGLCVDDALSAAGSGHFTGQLAVGIVPTGGYRARFLQASQGSGNGLFLDSGAGSMELWSGFGGVNVDLHSGFTVGHQSTSINAGGAFQTNREMLFKALNGGNLGAFHWDIGSTRMWTIPNGGDLLPGSDNARSVGASGTEVLKVWTQGVDDGDGTVDLGANLVPDADATHSLGASSSEYLETWTQGIDDSDGTVNVNASLLVTGAAHVDFELEVDDEARFNLDQNATGDLRWSSVAEIAALECDASSNTCDYAADVNVNATLDVDEDATFGEDVAVVGNLVGNLAANTPFAVWQVAGHIGTAPSGPTCDAGHAGSLVYVDDTNDSKPGALCFCQGDTDNGAGTVPAWNWTLPGTNSSCPVVF